LKRPQDIKKAIDSLLEENTNLQKQVEAFSKEKSKQIVTELKKKVTNLNGINFVGEIIMVDNAGLLKDIAFQLKDSIDNLVFVAGAQCEGKANLAVMISQNLVENNKLNATAIIREIAKEINGGGGGQPFFATAGGKNPEGLAKAIAKAKSLL